MPFNDYGTLNYSRSKKEDPRTTPLYLTAIDKKKISNRIVRMEISD